MTEEMLRAQLPKDVTIRKCRVPDGPNLLGCLGWKVTFPCGVVAAFSPYKLMGCERQKASWEEYEQAAFKCCHLANEIFGGIGIYGGASKKDTRATIEWAEAQRFKVNDNPSRPFTRRQMGDYFHEDAIATKKSGGWQISLPNGSGVLIKNNRIENVRGDAWVYEAALKMMNENYGCAIVSGTKENILSGIAHGSLHGIEVIPEQYTAESTYKRVGMVCGAICALPCVVTGMTYDNVLVGLLGGMLAAWLMSFIYCAVFLRNSQKKARERGQALKNSHPPIHGASASRKASIDAARARGML
jgi:hypothetical protein